MSPFSHLLGAQTLRIQPSIPLFFLLSTPNISFKIYHELLPLPLGTDIEVLELHARTS